MIYDLFCDLVILQHREGDVKMCVSFCIYLWHLLGEEYNCKDVLHLDITTKQRKKSGLHSQCLQLKHLAET